MTDLIVTLSENPEPTFQEWEEQGTNLANGHRQINWMIGDWLVYGIEQFGAEAQTLACDKFGRTPSELKKALDVAKRFPLEQRRPELSFTHYQHLATLPEGQATPLIETAVQEGLTAKDLGKRVAKVRESEGGEVFEIMKNMSMQEAEDKWYSETARQFNRAPSVEIQNDWREALEELQRGDLMEP